MKTTKTNVTAKTAQKIKSPMYLLDGRDPQPVGKIQHPGRTIISHYYSGSKKMELCELKSFFFREAVQIKDGFVTLKTRGPNSEWTALYNLLDIFDEFRALTDNGFDELQERMEIVYKYYMNPVTRNHSHKLDLFLNDFSMFLKLFRKMAVLEREFDNIESDLRKIYNHVTRVTNANDHEEKRKK